MTEKKQNILDSALKLFAQKGYPNTSTAKVAESAGVSEGLIFKHFGSKQELLEAVFNVGHQHIDDFVEEIKSIQDPKKVIEAAFNFPFALVRENRTFWKLQFSLDYQSPHTCPKYSDNNLSLMVTLPALLEDAFKELGYDNPEMEARFLMVTLGGLCTAIIHDKNKLDDEFCQFVMEKYNL